MMISFRQDKQMQVNCNMTETVKLIIEPRGGNRTKAYKIKIMFIDGRNTETFLTSLVKKASYIISKFKLGNFTLMSSLIKKL